jgi:hypothetical protein
MIPPELIARLAELYDTYNNAFDPLSAESGGSQTTVR